ncbi:MAG: lysoplasmalogenase family protein [Candidatus Hermodarchaeota archaeon]
MQKKMLWLVYFISIVVLIFEIYRQATFILTEVVLFPFFLASSVLISIAAVIIRLFIIDPQKFSTVILDTDIHASSEISSEKTLSPLRFLNLMPIAMISCSIADLLIAINFILGVLTFVVAQILYVIAYSGIIRLNPKTVFTGKKKSLALVSSIGWILISTILYITLIFSPEDILTLFVIPYVIVLTLMVIIAFFGLGYIGRSLNFRLMLCGGAIFFLISDTILAFNEFNTPIYGASMLIGSTYLLAVFMLQFAILFLRFPNGSSIMRVEK